MIVFYRRYFDFTWDKSFANLRGILLAIGVVGDFDLLLLCSIESIFPGVVGDCGER